MADLWNDLTGIKDAEQDHDSSVRLTAECGRASNCKCRAKHKQMQSCRQLLSNKTENKKEVFSISNIVCSINFRTADLAVYFSSSAWAVSRQHDVVWGIEQQSIYFIKKVLKLVFWPEWSLGGTWMIVCTFYVNPSNSCWHISSRNANVTAKVMMTHPLCIIHLSTRLHGQSVQ